MIRPLEYDVIILGGGCAGLSLAMRLALYGMICPRVLILEQRADYTHDRTWCFWDDGYAAFGNLATYRWQKMLLSANNQNIDFDCQSFSYCKLSADIFYEEALTTIAATEAITLMLEQKIVQKLMLTNGFWQIETEKEIFYGKIIIDTRSNIQPIRGAAILWQSFLGHEISCEAAIFDPSRVVLMDFQKPNTHDVRFTYVLPFSPHHALIESTVFAADPLQSQDLLSDIDAAIKKYTRQNHYKIRRSEYAVLPMGMECSKPDLERNYIQVGLTAGGARSSSGYAFQRIQAWAQLCADSIIKQDHAVAHPQDFVVQSFMDRLFLRVLRAEPQRGSALFLALFNNARAESVIRFLSDRASLIDYVSIILALPMAPFLKQLWCLAIRRLILLVRP